jgi:hypothetical protein
MQTKIELSDCMFKLEEPVFSRRKNTPDIEMVLPVILWLGNLRYTKDHPSDHFRYRNQFGDLAITCSREAYFEPNYKNHSEEEMKLFYTPIGCLTSRTNSCFSGLDTFVINDEDIKKQLTEEITSEKILSHLTQSQQWNQYLNIFIDWLNEFKREHPENAIQQGTHHSLHFVNNTHAYLNWKSSRKKVPKK